ncbi:MAG: biotin/lipoyl-containing protein, partial [Burkholderiales bacterium]
MASTKVVSDIAGKVWKIEAPAGTKVAQDDAVLILESMKMEIPLPA